MEKANSEMASRRDRIVIVGSGIIGMTVALVLAEAGYNCITVIARNLPGDQSTDWASPWAGAGISLHPDSGMNEFQEVSLKHWRELILTAEPCAGIRRYRATEYYNDRSAGAKIWYTHILQGPHEIAPSKLPPGANMGFSYDSIAVNPTEFLPWIFNRLQNFGVTFVEKHLKSLSEIDAVIGTEPNLIINASGSGATQLAGDKTLSRIRGQTMIVKVPDEFLGEGVMLQGSEYTYTIPRPGDNTLVMGGFSDAEDYRVLPDQEAKGNILRRVNKITNNRFSWVDLDKHLVKDVVGFRPGRKGGVRVEREGRVIHAYGMGGLGYVYSFGVAHKVKELVQQREAKI